MMDFRSLFGALKRSPRVAGLGALVVLYFGWVLFGMWWWNGTPRSFDVDAAAARYAAAHSQSVVSGTATTVALREVTAQLLDKRGGYLSNDLVPPGAIMDDVPNFEFGALTQARDLAKALRNEFSRAQSQSAEDADLTEADPLFSTTNDRWLLPSSESQYRQAMQHLDGYLKRLAAGDPSAQFHARADNLADWLAVVEKRLGGLSQRLSASVGRASDGAAAQAQTPWMQIDDVFYEARGSAWALAIFLHAAKRDFATVLRDKNAGPGLDAIIRELEQAQEPLSSPIVLNGSPYGFFANHSLVIANYISRANAAVIDLRKLLERG